MSKAENEQIAVEYPVLRPGDECGRKGNQERRRSLSAITRLDLNGPSALETAKLLVLQLHVTREP